MAVQPRPTGVTTSMRRSVGSVVSECKANAFNNEQEKYLGQRISTARLARVQEAIKQLKENNRVGAEKASGRAAVAQGKTREVLLVGRDYAIVFENGSGKSTVELSVSRFCAQWVVIT